MNRIAFCLVLAGTLLVTGCAYLAPPISRPWQDSPMEYYQRVQSASEEERNAEFAYLESQTSEQNAVVLNTKRALLLSVPADSSVQDESRALAFLDSLELGSVLSQPAYDYLQLGVLWREVLQQRQQLREAGQESAQLRAQLEELRRQNLELEEQIEALKSIETQLNQREQ